MHPRESHYHQKKHVRKMRQQRKAQYIKNNKNTLSEEYAFMARSNRTNKNVIEIEEQDFSSLSLENKVIYLAMLMCSLSTAFILYQHFTRNNQTPHTNTNTTKLPVNTTDITAPMQIANRPVVSLVSHEMSCTQTNDIHNAAKFCTIKSKNYNGQYLLRPADTTTSYNDPSIENVNINTMEYNQQLIRLIGAMHPATALVYEENGQLSFNSHCAVGSKNSFFCPPDHHVRTELYQSIESSKQYVSYQNICQRISKQSLLQFLDIPFFARPTNELAAEEFRKQVGDKGIAQLAVSGFCIEPAYLSPTRFGYYNQSVMIFDTRLSRLGESLRVFRQYESLYEHAANRVPQKLAEMKLYFSKDTIIYMRDIFQKLLESPKPYIKKSQDTFPAINISSIDTFNTMLKHYHHACESVLTQLSIVNPNEHTTTPKMEINTLLDHALKAEMKSMKNTTVVDDPFHMSYKQWI